MSLLAVGMSSVGPSVAPRGGISATRLALGDEPLVAAPPDIVGGVIEPPAPDGAAATPPVAAMAGKDTCVATGSSERSLPGYWIERSLNQSLRYHAGMVYI